jgi:hypothetical protein
MVMSVERTLAEHLRIGWWSALRNNILRFSWANLVKSIPGNSSTALFSVCLAHSSAQSAADPPKDQRNRADYERECARLCAQRT